MVILLADRSAWAQLDQIPAARERFAALLTGAELATCPAVVGELLFSARSQAQLQRQRYELETLLWLETTDDAQDRALAVQQQLSRHGQHRGVGLVDLFVAATAEAHRATVLHYDSDFERIAEVTGQPHEWIVPRGRGHRSPGRQR